MSSTDDADVAPSVSGPIRLQWALMQASLHVDDDVAMRELSSFVRVGEGIRIVGALLTYVGVVGSIGAAILMGGRVGTHVGLVAGIVAMMVATVVCGGAALLIVGLVQQFAWRAVTARLDARMDALGWSQPGTRVVDRGVLEAAGDAGSIGA